MEIAGQARNDILLIFISFFLVDIYVFFAYNIGMKKFFALKSATIPTWLVWGLSALFVLITYFIMLNLSPYSIWFSLFFQITHPLLILLNCLPIALLLVFFYFCFNNLFLSFFLVFSLESALCLINRFKIIIRDAPFIPNDVFLIREASGVFSFKYIKSSWFAMSVVCGIALAFLLLAFLTKTKKHGKKTRWLTSSSSIIVLILSVVFVFSNKSLYNNFNSYLNYNLASIYNDFGFNYAFLNIITKDQIEKPEGYSKKIVEDLIAEYSQKEAVEPKVKPNIVVIQDEAFYDLTLWNAFNYSADEQPLKNYLNIIHSNQAIAGRNVTYGFGGGTDDSEFEVSTGMSTENIGQSVASAFSVISKNSFSINHALGDFGYTSSFYHPGKNWFYNRANVYRYFGYKNIIFEKNGFQNTGFDTSGFVHDSVFMNNFEKLYKETLSPSFITGVTIENHGPYNDNRYKKTYPIKLKRGVKLSDEARWILGNYITGLKNTDDMLKSITDFYDSKKEPVILLFYGDHKPYLGADYLGFRELDKKFAKGSSAKDNIATYETPYFIWSNKAGLKSFQINLQKINKTNTEELSCFYLGGLLTQLAGYENLSPFTQFTNEARDILPVMHKGNYKTGTSPFESKSAPKFTKTLDETQQELVKNYKFWQYYLMKSKIN